MNPISCNNIACACVQYSQEFAFETTTAIDSFKILGIDDSRSKIIFTPSQNHLAIKGSIEVVFKIFGIFPICNSSLISLYNEEISGLDSSPSFTNGICCYNLNPIKILS